MKSKTKGTRKCCQHEYSQELLRDINESLLYFIEKEISQHPDCTKKKPNDISQTTVDFFRGFFGVGTTTVGTIREEK